MESIIQDKKECFICGKTTNLHNHHIMFGKNRNKADKDGLTVYLCYNHHEGTNGVHGKNGHDLDIYLKTIAENEYLKTYRKNIDDFIERYGKNYL